MTSYIPFFHPSAALALLGLISPVQAAADQRPNIVHIVADDLGWKDVGFNGCTDIKTPNLDALTGASTAKCKPLDGVNVWSTIAEGKPSPRTEVIYNVEPFRGAVRQGDWKLIWRTLIPTSVDLYNLAEDPSETNNCAAAYPDKVAAMQERLNTLGKESAKPLALIYVGSVGLAHGKPLLPTKDGSGPAPVNGDGHSITDEGFGEGEVHP